MELQLTLWKARHVGKWAIKCDKNISCHLIQGHAQGTDEAPIVVLQSDGRGWSIKKKGMGSNVAQKWNVGFKMYFHNCTNSDLHIHLGVVDEILQRISTRIVILELCIVGDCPNGGIEGSDHPADVDRLDVGEIGEYPRPRCTCGLWSGSTETSLFKKWFKINTGKHHRWTTQWCWYYNQKVEPLCPSQESEISSVCIAWSQEETDSNPACLTGTLLWVLAFTLLS